MEVQDKKFCVTVVVLSLVAFDAFDIKRRYIL